MEIPTKGSCKWELIPLNFYFKPTLFLFHAMSWINIVRYAQGNARALNPPPRPSRAPPVWGDSPRMLLRDGGWRWSACRLARGAFIPLPALPNLWRCG